MNAFDQRMYRPMLIGRNQEVFDDKDYLYEMKFDGIRCLIYFDETIDIRNRSNQSLLAKFPELTNIKAQVNVKCVLDCELIVLEQGMPNFYELLRRTTQKDAFKAKLSAERHPANVIVFDVLYYQDQELLAVPLVERKKILSNLMVENRQIAMIHYIEEYGTALFELTIKHGLEGIVAKHKQSLYESGKRTKEWIKIKNLLDEDFVVCGYVLKEKGHVNLILGQYEDDCLVSVGQVTIGMSDLGFVKQYLLKKQVSPIFATNESNVVWLEPKLVCTVTYMAKTSGGGIRQPVWKGMRDDKDPKECITNQNVR